MSARVDVGVSVGVGVTVEVFTMLVSWDMQWERSGSAMAPPPRTAVEAVTHVRKNDLLLSWIL
jgi:hypothetical protein